MIPVELVTAALRAKPPPPPWMVPLFLAAFAGVWVAITAFLGVVAGHVALLARFPPILEPEQEKYRFASGLMRRARFNNGLHVGIGARGLHLAPIAAIRPLLHRGIPCIPWHEIRLVAAESKDGWGRSTGSRFEIPSMRFEFRLYGEPGLAVARRLSSGAGVESRPRSRLVRE